MIDTPGAGPRGARYILRHDLGIYTLLRYIGVRNVRKRRENTYYLSLINCVKSDLLIDQRICYLLENNATVTFAAATDRLRPHAPAPRLPLGDTALCRDTCSTLNLLQFLHVVNKTWAAKF